MGLFADYILRPSRTPGAGASAPVNGAPNGAAVSAATPAMSPMPSGGGMPPEIAALLQGLNGAAQPAAPAMPQQPQQPQQGMAPEQPQIDPAVIMEYLARQQPPGPLGTDPNLPQEVGAPLPTPPANPPIQQYGMRSFAPDFRQQFISREGYPPGRMDYKLDAVARDIEMRTGSPPMNKADLMLSLQTPMPPAGIPEWQ